MFIEERHQVIQQLLKEKGRLEVQELSTLFNVSDDSIRRDLRIMEQKGILERTYGGAVLPKKANYYPSYTERMKSNKKNKEGIAKLAASFIQNGDTIFLDGSTTVAEMIPYLNRFENLTVITHSVMIGYEIVHAEGNIQLIMIGGCVHQKAANAFGIDTVKAIEKLRADKVYVAPCAISAESGLSCSSIEEAPIKKAIMEAGREVYLMAESDKFGKRSLISFAPLEVGQTILTDSGLSSELYAEFSELTQRGLKILWK